MLKQIDKIKAKLLEVQVVDDSSEIELEATQTEPQDSAYIQPLVRINGESHALEKIFNEDPDNMPVMTSVGYLKLDPNRNHSWVSFTMTSKGSKVLKIEVSDPDMKMIAEESAKIAFVSQLSDQDA